MTLLRVRDGFARHRRLRRTEGLRRLVAETRLSPSDFVYPLFLTHGRNVREEIHEHPSQFLIRCRDASRIAALLFEQDHITQVQLQDDRLGLLVMTRSRTEFAKALTRIALGGHSIESVVAADENVDALYEYLIGGGR